MIQQTHSYQLSALKAFHVTTFHDGRNVFWSLGHDEVCEACKPPFAPTHFEHHFLVQRVRYAVVCLGGRADKKVHLLVKAGVIPGDHAGPTLLNVTMGPATARAARRHRLRSPCPELLRITCPFYDAPAQTSLTVYVDDTADKATGRNRRGVLNNKLVMDAEVAGALKEIGIALNSDKQENVLDGPHQFDLQVLRGQLDNVTIDARYLGCRHVLAAAPATEVGYRLAAMKKAWYALLAFYNSDAPLDFKVTVPPLSTQHCPASSRSWDFDDLCPDKI